MRLWKKGKGKLHLVDRHRLTNCGILIKGGEFIDQGETTRIIKKPTDKERGCVCRSCFK